MNVLNFLKKKIYKNERTLSKLNKILIEINKIEPELEILSDKELKEKIINFKNSDNKNIEMSFALTREVSKRLINIRHYDVQILGGLVLVDNAIAELKTGEGKTFIAALAAIYKAINHKKVHVVTVNDYLSERDKNSLEPVYNFFDLSVSFNKTNNTIDVENKKQIYSSDIIYGTNSEFCFDYMRNNLAKNKNDRFYNNDLEYVIIDEVDSVLIDEAKNPLILSDSIDMNLFDFEWSNDLVVNFLKRSDYDSTEFTNKLAEIESLRYNPEEVLEPNGDYFYNASDHSFNIFESGYDKIEEYMVKNNIIKNKNDIYKDSKNILLITNALKAHCQYIKNRDYIVDENNNVVIIDLFTGRLKQNSRWNNLIHQAIEFKEGVEVKGENKVVSRTTYQNYFNLYKEKSGMTGTASTEANELLTIYNLDTVIIPTNKQTIRNDLEDKMFVHSESKYDTIINDIKERHEKGQPILIGTPMLYISEKIADLLTKNNIDFNILNAKNHHREADIISESGRLNSITISTNMAGRGTDIILGGNIKSKIDKISNDNLLSDDDKNITINNITNLWREERNKVIELGGLYVLGIDKNESRRIDNQLRGRSGRQGEVGETVFYTSLEDELVINNTKPEMLKHIVKFFDKFEEYNKNNIQTSFGSWGKTISKAQEQVENYNYSIRKELLKFDTVIQEKYLFLITIRNNILFSNNDEINDILLDYIGDYIELESFVNINIDTNFKDLELEKENIIAFLHSINKKTTENEVFEESENKINSINFNGLNHNQLINKGAEVLLDIYNLRWKNIEVIEGQNHKYEFVRLTILEVIDELWSNYLDSIDSMKKNSNLSHFGGKDSFTEFKHNAHRLFLELLALIKTTSADKIINENMSLDLIDINDIKDFKFSDEVNNMSEEQISSELLELTSKLMAKDILDIHDKLK